MSAPPPVPALPDTQRLTSYSISSSTGPFAVNFALYGDGADFGNWIEVWLNDNLLNAGTDYTLTSPTGAIGAIARPITDAVITLTVASTGTLVIIGARRPRRVVQFSENTGVAARDLNQALTDIVADQREAWDFARTRQMYFPGGETISSTKFPIATARANKFFSFDSSGNPLFISAVIPQAPIEYVTPEQFGADGTAVNDTAAINAAAATGHPIRFMPRTYLLTGANTGGHLSTVYVNTVGNPQHWIGAGKDLTKIQLIADSTFNPVKFFGFSGGIGVHIEGITFDGNGHLAGTSSDFPNILPCLYIEGTNDAIVERCGFIGFHTAGVLLNTCDYYIVRDNYVNRGSADGSFANYGINCTVGNYGLIDNNDVLFADISTDTTRQTISRNRVRGWLFSAGINTQSTTNSFENTIINNMCWNTGNTTPDANGYYSGGIENWSTNSIVTGNRCFDCVGNGIDQGGPNSVVADNVCYNNGRGGAGATAQSGIVLRFQDSTYNASKCVVQGNRCFDNAGGTQLFGYAELSGQSGITVGVNNFQNNVTGPYSLVPANNTIIPVNQTAVTVANLPSAASNKGSRWIVSDATATTFWSIVAGSGSNLVPVTSDGTNWRIG